MEINTNQIKKNQKKKTYLDRLTQSANEREQQSKYENETKHKIGAQQNEHTPKKIKHAKTKVKHWNPRTGCVLCSVRTMFRYWKENHHGLVFWLAALYRILQCAAIIITMWWRRHRFDRRAFIIYIFEYNIEDDMNQLFASLRASILSYLAVFFIIAVLLFLLLHTRWHTKSTRISILSYCCFCFCLRWFYVVVGFLSLCNCFIFPYYNLIEIKMWMTMNVKCGMLPCF